MFENKCDTVKKIIKKWIPGKKYPEEKGYRDELSEFIRKELKRHEQDIIFGTPEKHIIKKEAGRARADIEIDRKIGIELKRNLSGKSDMNRFFGQISDYESEYDCIIVVLCGEVKEETVEELDYKLDQINKRSMVLFIDEPKIALIRKDEAKIKRGKKRR